MNKNQFVVNHGDHVATIHFLRMTDDLALQVSVPIRNAGYQIMDIHRKESSHTPEIIFQVLCDYTLFSELQNLLVDLAEQKNIFFYIIFQSKYGEMKTFSNIEDVNLKNLIFAEYVADVAAKTAGYLGFDSVPGLEYAVKNLVFGSKLQAVLQQSGGTNVEVSSQVPLELLITDNDVESSDDSHIVPCPFTGDPHYAQVLSTDKLDKKFGFVTTWFDQVNDKLG